MLNLVKTTLPILKRLLEGKNLGLMLIFFDGEEAFVNWSAEDSIYGSRHLAKKWELTKYKNVREIDRIVSLNWYIEFVEAYNIFSQNVLILLDLIGASNARFTCTFRDTCVLNQRLNEIESKLKNTASLKTFFNAPANIFLKSFKRSGVADDHVPFLERSVPILHLIPQSFPSTWHTNNDDEQNVDQNAVLNFNRIMRVFLVEYFMDCTSSNPPSKCRLK